ncbi:MAG TPA: hypothetical protein VIM51_08030 [Desulfosporosinus sp.]
MITRLFFTLEYNGELIPNLYTQLKQKVRSNFNEEEIEVAFPEGIIGPFDFEAFTVGAKEFFLRLVGPRGCGINITEGCSNTRIMSSTFRMLYEVELFY